MTNSDGIFEIDVAPGHHEFVAERPGHEPVTLPTVAVDEAGNVAGVVDMFLVPGDEGESDIVIADGAALDIELPAAGASVVVGVPALFTVAGSYLYLSSRLVRAAKAKRRDAVRSALRWRFGLVLLAAVAVSIPAALWIRSGL